MVTALIVPGEPGEPDTCYLAGITVARITPAMQYHRNPRGASPTALPWLMLEYRPSDLPAMTELIKALKEAEQFPAVHIWDGDTGHTEIAVIFRLAAGTPPAGLQKSCSTPLSIGSVVATAETDFEPADVRAFVEVCRAARALFIRLVPMGKPAGPAIIEIATLEVSFARPAVATTLNS